MNALRYRVAAPSIRIVPRAALASCWPLPQQLLPVSATGGGRRRCALRIFSGKIIFNRAMPERLRTLRHCIFTGRGRNGKRQLPRLLPTEAAARRERFCLLNSLSQNLTVLTAPSGREPLARPQTLRLNRKLYRYAKGPIPEGAVCAADWGSFFTHIFSAQIVCIPSKLLKNARFFVR